MVGDMIKGLIAVKLFFFTYYLTHDLRTNLQIGLIGGRVGTYFPHLGRIRGRKGGHFVRMILGIQPNVAFAVLEFLCWCST
jgi:hypothetical protein